MHSLRSLLTDLHSEGCHKKTWLCSPPLKDLKTFLLSLHCYTISIILSLLNNSEEWQILNWSSSHQITAVVFRRCLYKERIPIVAFLKKKNCHWAPWQFWWVATSGDLCRKTGYNIFTLDCSVGWFRPTVKSFSTSQKHVARNEQAERWYETPESCSLVKIMRTRKI